MLQKFKKRIENFSFLLHLSPTQTHKRVRTILYDFFLLKFFQIIHAKDNFEFQSNSFVSQQLNGLCKLRYITKATHFYLFSHFSLSVKLRLKVTETWFRSSWNFIQIEKERESKFTIQLEKGILERTMHSKVHSSPKHDLGGVRVDFISTVCACVCSNWNTQTEPYEK